MYTLRAQYVETCMTTSSLLCIFIHSICFHIFELCLILNQYANGNRDFTYRLTFFVFSPQSAACIMRLRALTWLFRNRLVDFTLHWKHSVEGGLELFRL